MPSAPPSRADLLSLAKHQLYTFQNMPTQHVPDDYLEELERHLILYPNDNRFLINIEPGRGFGSVICLETGCGRAIINLVARVDLPDGGLARGFGSLSSYHVHIACNSAAHDKSNNIALIRPKAEPTFEPSPPLFPSASPRSSLPNIIDARRSSSSAGVEFEPESSNVKFEGPESIISRKRLLDLLKRENELPPKRLKLETSKMPLAFATNSPSSPPSYTTPQNASDIRMRLSEIQSQIISNRRLLENVQRKAQKSVSDRTREARLLAAVRSLETEKLRLGVSLPASTAARDLERTLPTAGVSTAVVPPAIRLPATPEQRHLIIDLPHFPLPLSQQPIASGSNVVLNAFPKDEPMDVNPTMPFSFTAKADEINQFLLAAGNAAFFDGEATVDKSLASLGLKDLFTTLPGMNVALMSHQVLSLDWMIEQEKKLKMQGGVLADEMGLGKTVQMIALMVKNKSKNPKCKMNLVVAPLALLDQWQLEIETKTDCGIKCYIHHGQGKLKKKSDIEKYDVILTTYGTLTAEWPEPEADKKKQPRVKQDTFLVDDLGNAVNPTIKKKTRGLLFDIEVITDKWYRVILDEGHTIRNRRTLASRAVVELESTYRWCLSGTPIINGLADAYGLLRFLRISPWDDWKEFNSHITLIEKRRPDLAAIRLQSIFRTMLLRRKKDTLLGGRRLIELPPKEINLRKLEFSQEERDIYKMVETKSQVAFNKFLRAGTVLKNYTQVLVLLLRLRQICSHPVLITDENSEGSDSAGDEASTLVSEYDRALRLVGAEFVTKMIAKLKRLAAERMEAERQSADATLDEECPICFDVSTDAVVCTCTHIFCRECIANVLNTPEPREGVEGLRYKADERPCPVCRSPVSREMLFSRNAFEPVDVEFAEDDLVMEDCNPNGKGKAKESGHAHGSNSHETDDEDLSGFIVPDDEDDDISLAPQKRSGKRRATVILDSDDEDDYDDVIIGAVKDTKVAITTPLMSEHEISTKMKQMMVLLQKWKQENPDEKVIIISQWTRYLEIVSRYLTSESFVHVLYQGSMSRNERNRAVGAFMRMDNKVSVLLMSLKSGGVGLNLTRANRVISLDLSWSAAVEGQSFDRVHRLGQTKTVFVERLVIADTVEDRILALQERKKALSDGSLGEGNGKKIGRLSVKELANLFGLDHRGHAL